MSVPGGSLVKNLSANAGDLGSIPDLGRSPGEGNGYPFQYSCLENSWQATVHGVAERVGHDSATNTNIHIYVLKPRNRKNRQSKIDLLLMFLIYSKETI